MNGKPVTPKRRKYDANFKAEVLKMVESGQSVPELSKNLGISESIIYRWQYKSKPIAKEVGKGDSLPALQAENEGLKARLKQTELERDILWKPRPFSAGRPKTHLPVYATGRKRLFSWAVMPGVPGES